MAPSFLREAVILKEMMTKIALSFWPGLARVKASGAPCRPGPIIRSWVLRPCRDGGLLVAAADPFLAVLEADGSVRWSHSSPNADFRGQRDKLAMSADGAIVDFGFYAWGKSPLRFDLRARKLSHDPPADDQTIRPKQDGLPIEGWENKYHPTLDGQPIALKALRAVTELGHPSRRKPLRAWNRLVSASLQREG